MLDLENSKFATNMCEIEESTHQKEFRCQVDIELYKSKRWESNHGKKETGRVCFGLFKREELSNSKVKFYT
jgi:hypothetical protein